jgi:hypothetical protein
MRLPQWPRWQHSRFRRMKKGGPILPPRAHAHHPEVSEACR